MTQKIYINTGKLHEALEDIEDILQKTSILYKKENRLVRLFADSYREVDSLFLLTHLSKNATFKAKRGKQYVTIDCPESICRAFLSKGDWNLPELKGIIHAPTIKENGQLLINPGYDEESGIYMNVQMDAFPSISSFISQEEAVECMEELFDVFKEFPFANSSSPSVVISAILTGLIRKSISTAPLHAFTAPKMGSGKSLLATCVSLIVTGKSISMVSPSANESEEGKRLLAVLQDGDPIICIDNIEKPFGSPTLCSILTEKFYKGRLLGKTQTAVYPTNSLFLATGNNLVFQGDLSTRVLLCTLDAEVQNPEQRKFSLNLHKEIPKRRGDLLVCGLKILKGYNDAGRPSMNITPFGRFEEWSSWVRGAIVWCGWEDPCASRSFVEDEDPVRVTLTKLLSSWFELVGSVPLRIKDLYNKALESAHESLIESLEEISYSGKKKEVCMRRVSHYLRAHQKRIEGGYRAVRAGSYQNADTWKVEKL